MSVEEIRERRRNRIMARANRQQNPQPPQQQAPPPTTQQPKASMPHQQSLCPPPELPQQQPSTTTSHTSQPQQSSSNIREHVSTVLTRKRYKSLLLHGSKAAGSVLGLLSSADNNSYDWIVIVAVFLIFTTLFKILSPASELQKSEQASKATAKKSQIQTINDIFNSLSSALQHLKLMGSIACSYLLAVFMKVQLRLY